MSKDLFVQGVSDIKSIYFDLSGLALITYDVGGHFEVNPPGIRMKNLSRVAVGNIVTIHHVQRKSYSAIEAAAADATANFEETQRSVSQQLEQYFTHTQEFRALGIRMGTIIDQGQAAVFRIKEIQRGARGGSLEEIAAASDLANQEIGKFNNIVKDLATAMKDYLRNPLTTLTYELQAETLRHAVSQLEPLIESYRGLEAKNKDAAEIKRPTNPAYDTAEIRRRTDALNHMTDPDTGKKILPGEVRRQQEELRNLETRPQTSSVGSSVDKISPVGMIYDRLKSLGQSLFNLMSNSGKVHLDKDDADNPALLEAAATIHILDIPLGYKLRQPEENPSSQTPAGKPGTESADPKEEEMNGTRSVSVDDLKKNGLIPEDSTTEPKGGEKK